MLIFRTFSARCQLFLVTRGDAPHVVRRLPWLSYPAPSALIPDFCAEPRFVQICVICGLTKCGLRQAEAYWSCAGSVDPWTVVFFEQLTEFQTGLVQLRLRGADGTAQKLSDLLMLITFDVVQNETRAITR